MLGEEKRQCGTVGLLSKVYLIGRREAVSSEEDTANGISQLAVIYLPAKCSRQRV